MKSECKVCHEIKEGVGPQFIKNEYRDPESPFTQQQMVAVTIVMCKDCYEKFKNRDININ